MTLFRHAGADPKEHNMSAPFIEGRCRHASKLVRRIVRGSTLQLFLIMSTLASTGALDAQQGSSLPKPPFSLAALEQASLKPQDLIGRWKVAWIGSYFSQEYSTAVSVTSPTVLNRQADLEFVSDGRLMILKDSVELALWKWNTEGTQEFSITHAGGYVEHCWAVRLTKASIILSQMHSFVTDGTEKTEIMLLLLYQETEKNYTVP